MCADNITSTNEIFQDRKVIAQFSLFFINSDIFRTMPLTPFPTKLTVWNFM